MTDILPSACSCDSSGAMMNVDEALAMLIAAAKPLQDVESITLDQAYGRVLAEDVVACCDNPPCDNSAMDGYAFLLADLEASVDSRLRVEQRICAGDSVQVLVPGTAARIFTGAPVPKGADVVVMQEQTEFSDGYLRVTGRLRQGENVRCQGEDIKAGSLVLAKGVRLGAQHIGLLASQGIADLKVWRRPRVAVFSTGDELVALGEPLGSGQIYDSNRYALKVLLQRLGCEVVDLGKVADSLEATRKVLLQAATVADLIVTSGGVSVGEEDHVRTAVESLGKINLWRIAMKPGKPLAYGEVQGVPFFGSPGNPVSSFVTFTLFVRPYILRLQGVVDVMPRMFDVVAAFDWPKPGKRREFVRAAFGVDEHGCTTALLYPHQGSGVLSSLAWAEGLVVIPEGKAIAAGERVSCIPFSGVLC